MKRWAKEFCDAKGKWKEIEFSKTNQLEIGWISVIAADLPKGMAKFYLVTSMNQKSIFAVDGYKGGLRDAIINLNCNASELNSCAVTIDKKILKACKDSYLCMPNA